MAFQKQGNKSDKRSRRGFQNINDDLSFEDALQYTASLLDSASPTELDCGERLEIARATVDRSIECVKPLKATA